MQFSGFCTRRGKEPRRGAIKHSAASKSCLQSSMTETGPRGRLTKSALHRDINSLSERPRGRLEKKNAKRKFLISHVAPHATVKASRVALLGLGLALRSLVDARERTRRGKHWSRQRSNASLDYSGLVGQHRHDLGGYLFS